MGWLTRLLGRQSGPTTHTDDDFRLTLDGVWRPDHEDTHFGFAQDDEKQQVTASVLRAKAILDTPQMLAVALDLVAKRQSAFRSLSGSDVTFGQVTTAEREGGYDVAFTAADLTHGVQSYVLVCARPRRVVTLSYNKYTPLLSETAFLGRWAAIRAGFQVL
jgi:hypothetical protein